MKIHLTFVDKEDAKLIPTKGTKKAACFDLKSNIDTVIAPGRRVLIPTGIKIQLPTGYEALVRPRSGLAIKNGITVLNSNGTIDEDYRGEVGVILINLGEETFKVKKYDRIAQLAIRTAESTCYPCMFAQNAGETVFKVVDELEETERNEGGFGHTGTASDTATS